MKRNNHKGFTLIELIVVMSIIALLSGISLFALQAARVSGRDARRQSDLEMVRSALEMYRADCGEYPPNATMVFNGTTSLVGNGTSCPVGNIYLQVIPADATAGRDYAYSRGANPATYSLCASLEGGTNSLACGSLAAGSCTANCNYVVRNP